MLNQHTMNAERFLIAHMLRSMDVTFKVQEMLEGNSLNIDEHQAIITYLYGFYESDHIPDLNSFIHYVDDENLRRIIVEIEMMQINEEIIRTRINGLYKSGVEISKNVKNKRKRR